VSGAGAGAGVAPAVPLPAVLAGGGVVAAVEGLDVLSAELAGGVALTLVSVLREQAATEPASATAINATSKGFAELRLIGFMINLQFK